MNTTDILSALDQEIARLRSVRDLLADSELPAKRRGRPKGSTNKEASSSAPGGVRKKRTMSAEGKARIAAAQRARWAKLNSPAKSSGKTVLAKRTSGKKAAKQGSSSKSKKTAITQSVGKSDSSQRAAGRKVARKKVAAKSQSKPGRPASQPKTATESQVTE